MYLKSLTVRGFKSFASSTTLRFEPGVTAVVGPNGSGKSNVVDALAWVLGEQGAKTLRGGKMEDVIFAGTPGRPPLGRAEVVVLIDNSDGALPIDYTEVTISRLMFRSGTSEYAINGSPCRLLDVQDLLSDAGLGREMHVIVGQGQLDAVLAAGPEDRRGFIEEAAGVLKHRKRKEKALRKLDAMATNLTRLVDLTAELRRQLGPLGKQAEVARRAAAVQADLRDARLRLLADDLDGLQTALGREVRAEAALRERRTAIECELAEVTQREAALEQTAALAAPRLARAQETWYRLAALQERLRSTSHLAAERARHLASQPDAFPPGRDPEQLAAEAAEVRRQEAALADVLDAARAALGEAVARRAEAEASLAAEDRALVAVARAVADRREGLARLAGEVAAIASRIERGQAEIDRLSAACAAARERAARQRSELALLERQVGALDESELGLDARHESAAAALATAEDRLAGLVAEERRVERERSAWAARRDALELAVAGKDGAGALLAAADRLPGLLGSVAALLSVQPGYEAGVAAALGPIADALAVDSPEGALAAVALLRSEAAGRAGLLVAGEVGTPRAAAHTSRPVLPIGARWVADLVEVPEALAPALSRALARVVLVPSMAAAAALVEQDPTLRAVTPEGDLFAADWAAGGSTDAPSELEVRAALTEAENRLAEAARAGERCRLALSAAQDGRARAQAEVAAALVQLHESDARMAAAAEQLAQVGSAVRAASAEADLLARAREEAQASRHGDEQRLAELERAMTAAEATPVDADPDTAARDRLAAECAAARTAEVEARLAVRTGEERVHGLSGRADALARAAEDERTARIRLLQRRARREQAAVLAGEVAATAGWALERIAISLLAAEEERGAAEQARIAGEGELSAVRGRSRDLSAELEQLTDVVHRDEVARTEQRLRIEQLEARSAQDYGIAADTLVAEYGPGVPLPPSEDGGEPTAYDRSAQTKRAATAERALALLGKVNPLALEEYAALEERHAFLADQLADLKATRRDLLTVVGDVDERIQEVFASAFADTAREFEQVFETLFPGGEGRLSLTEPRDMLTTGIEIEARPAGKKVKRLSLLSGGERSLTAIALLVAIFRARPSPFYILDEVEAALDDVNLGRLLTLIDSLRASSQLIVVTHQKRMMEVADALYGVSMRGDGITTVISQRLHERESA